jgi:hypothetical protein
MRQFILEPYAGPASRYNCPACNKRKTLSLYVDTETGQHVAPHVGRCSRENNCGYHYKPAQYFKANKSFTEKRPISCKPITKHPSPVFSTIPVDVFKQSLKQYEVNNFISWCTGLFGEQAVSEMIARYFVGTSKYWDGATVFWQIDSKGEIRTGKIMLYNSATGKRVKQPFSHIQWAHAVLGQNKFELKQCLFGEHLLSLDPYKTVAIVESEKTAIIGSVCYPNYLWLACGSLQGLNAEKCKVLRDRTVWLYPDANGYDAWCEKARELRKQMPKATIKVDKTLEFHATDEERRHGIDIADRWIDKMLHPKEFKQ